ncbi:TPM domain-containing protein [Flavobacteriaceae bacterium]|nr:TPM domain-containing protein [Flavobacteriaceae bacterium]
MNSLENFLSTDEEQEIVSAILMAEKKTTGEIRVHLECRTSEPIDSRAKNVFHALKMDNTKLENGVLIYIAIENKKFGIYGDRGIDKKVNNNFWNKTRDVMQYHFEAGAFKTGIVEGIKSASEALEKFFPWETNDKDELSNEVSKGEV